LTGFSHLHHRVFSAYPDTTELDGSGFVLFAPAKINLGLRVIGRRPDGYHEIETVFQEISLCDRLEFHGEAQWSLEIRGATLDAGEANFVTRAARLLSRAAGVLCAARIVLHKEIPVGGGLGGGSSDGAVALIGLCRLWGLSWGAKELAPRAAEIGSDCPFFLVGGLAHGSGRGEVIEPLPECVPGTVVLVIPEFGVSTAWAYAAGGFPLTDEAKSVIFLSCIKDRTIPAWHSSCFPNDLENIVLRRYPELGRVKQKLLDFGAEGACLSGSGSALYGLFSDSARATHAAQQFGLPFRVMICRAVSRPRRT
jgi:4-diphosphocytidyl-2-C-methyl-D-erythritol kinase